MLSSLLNSYSTIGNSKESKIVRKPLSLVFTEIIQKLFTIEYTFLNLTNVK
jgi:hypothetical protein